MLPSQGATLAHWGRGWDAVHESQRHIPILSFWSHPTQQGCGSAVMLPFGQCFLKRTRGARGAMRGVRAVCTVWCALFY